jgi:hypothetical protein
MDLSIIYTPVTSHNFCLSIPNSSATIEHYIAYVCVLTAGRRSVRVFVLRSLLQSC